MPLEKLIFLNEVFFRCYRSWLQSIRPCLSLCTWQSGIWDKGKSWVNMHFSLLSRHCIHSWVCLSSSGYPTKYIKELASVPLLPFPSVHQSVNPRRFQNVLPRASGLRSHSQRWCHVVRSQKVCNRRRANVAPLTSKFRARVTDVVRHVPELRTGSHTSCYLRRDLEGVS